MMVKKNKQRLKLCDCKNILFFRDMWILKLQIARGSTVSGELIGQLLGMRTSSTPETLITDHLFKICPKIL